MKPYLSLCLITISALFFVAAIVHKDNVPISTRYMVVSVLFLEMGHHL